MTVLAFLFPWVLGVLWMNVLEKHGASPRPGLAWSAGFGLGMGVAAFLYGVGFFAGIHHLPVFPYLDMVVCALTGILLAWPIKKTMDPFLRTQILSCVPWRFSWIGIGYGILLAFSILLFIGYACLEPHGGWDAWAIWNLKARFLFRGVADGNQMFSSHISWSHPDYPLLLPSIIARWWNWAGRETMIIPAAVSGAFTFGLVFLSKAGLTTAQGRMAGYAGAFALLGTLNLVRHGAYLGADIPLAFFFLAAIVILVLLGDEPLQWVPGLGTAGFLAGCALWTKNEGMLFFPALLLGWAVASWKMKRMGKAWMELMWMVLGASPFLALWVVLKIHCSPSNDLLASLSLPLIADRLLDPTRHGVILRTAVWTIVKMGSPIVLCVFWFFLRDKKRIERTPARTAGSLALIFMAAGYYAAYLFSPYDLAWHLSTSAERLLLQIWPSALFLAILGLRFKPYKR